MMINQGIFKTFDDFPYDFFKINFEDLWELMECSYNHKDFSAEAKKRLGIISPSLKELAEKLFPIGNRISFSAHGRIIKGIVVKICEDGDSNIEKGYLYNSGDIIFRNDKTGNCNWVNISSIIEEFYWREIFPCESEKGKIN